MAKPVWFHVLASNQVKACDKRVQTPGMSPPRAGAWTYCLFTPCFGLDCPQKPYLTVKYIIGVFCYNFK